MTDKKTLTENIAQEIENSIRPALQSHGGDIELLGVDDGTGVVRVRLQGACSGCPGAQQTLKMGVESRLKETFPQVTSVQAEL